MATGMKAFKIKLYDYGIKFTAWIIMPDGELFINHFTTREINTDLR